MLALPNLEKHNQSLSEEIIKTQVSHKTVSSSLIPLTEKLEENNKKLEEISEKYSNLSKIAKEKQQKIKDFEAKIETSNEILEKLKNKYQLNTDLLSSKTESLQEKIQESEYLISETFALSEKKAAFVSKESNFYSAEIKLLMKPADQNTSDVCPVCRYPKVGRLKLCVQCQKSVHLKCLTLIDSACFNCKPLK